MASPREVDEKLAALSAESEQGGRQAARLGEQVHALAGDRKHWVGNRQVWQMTHGAAVTAVRQREVRESGQAYSPAAQVLRELAAVQRRNTEIIAESRALQDIYLAAPWPRYYPCENSNGHIHSSARGCPTVQPTTRMAWTPQLSGKPVAEAVAELGPWLCSVCFPDAPVEYRQDPAEAGKAERAAARAEREAQRWVKNLRPEEQEGFRDVYGSRVTTVHGAQTALRAEVEYRYSRTPGTPHPSYPEAAAAAARAREVLLARGVPAEDLDQIVTRAEKARAKEYGRTEPRPEALR